MHTTRTSQSQAEPVIRTSSLTKRFGDRVAVDAATLEVPRGCAFGFLGPNGAGKTTLIRTLLGLTRASGGTMALLGLPVPERRAEALARVGAIVEEPSFHGHLTGRENLWIAAAVRDTAAVERIDSSLGRMGLLDRADDRVSTYSMGMRQRLGIARCLLADPELLILDEPTNGLDPGGILEFRGFVRELVGEGRTVFLSHLLDEVEKICDAAAIVDGGRVLMQGTISEIATDGNLLVDLECGDREAAEGVLCALPVITTVARTDEGLRLTIAGNDREAIPGVTRTLVHAGIDIYRISPARRTLEERFLELTTTLGSGGMSGRMIAAEVLKLVRRRGQMIWGVILTVGAVVVAYGIAWGYHLSNAGKYGPAGGSHSLEGSLWIITTIGGVAAVLIGTAAGIGDQSAGVFRELVVTGRSRIALFAARVPGALIVLLPMVLLAFAVAVVCTFALAGDLRTPSASLIAKDAVWLVAVMTVQLLIALGFSAVVGSRATAVGVLLGWQLALSPLLLSIDQLGAVRQLIPRAAALRLEPFSNEPLGFAMTAGAAVAVLTVWTVVMLAVAARRTLRLEA